MDTCELGSTCDSAFLHVQRHQACELLVKSLNADDVTSHAIDDWSGSAEVERFHHSGKTHLLSGTSHTLTFEVLSAASNSSPVAKAHGRNLRVLLFRLLAKQNSLGNPGSSMFCPV